MPKIFYKLKEKLIEYDFQIHNKKKVLHLRESKLKSTKLSE